MASEHVHSPDPARPHSAAGGLVRAAVSVAVRHPSVTGEALRTLLAMAPRGWWRHRPFLPVPAPDYMAWRSETAYGARDAGTPEDDLYQYLVWRRRQRRAR